MIVRNPNTDLSVLYDKMYGCVQLGKVAQLTFGYFLLLGNVFTLKQCHADDQIVEGLSGALGRFVRLERAAVRPLITPKIIDDYIDVDFQDYSTFLITADHLASNFDIDYPNTFSYFEQCEGEGYELNETIIRSYQREAMDKKKIIISTDGNICHAMLDTTTHAVSTLKTYWCSFPKEGIGTYKAYLAIFNSQLFSYLFFHEMAKNRKLGQGRLTVLSEIPVPLKNEDFAILENLSDCLLYLSRPEVAPLSHKISNVRIGYHLTRIIDMVVYEMYFPSYTRERGLDVIRHMISAPFMLNMMSEEERIYETYVWYQKPENIVRQKMELLDTRSPELLYKIQNFNPNE